MAINVSRRLRTILATAALATAIVACSSVPETGRSRLSLLPETELVAMAAPEFDNLKSNTPVYKGDDLNGQLQRVGRRIVKAAISRGTSDALPPLEEWEFVVFDDPQLNAFAMPGGKVGFYKGIWSVFESDDDLAVVVGHEVAHVAAQHGNERISQQLGISLLGVGLQIGVGASDLSEENKDLIMGGFGLGTQYGVLLPFSRQHESEADEIGLIYMAEAGYDPRSSIGVWERMKASSGGSVPEFLSTHPSEETRIQRLTELMPRVLPIYEQNRQQ